MNNLPRAFDTEPLDLALDRMLPSRTLPKNIGTSRKYAQIRASMQEVGMIEPLAVSAPDRKTGLYLVLDGHQRLHVARELGLTHISCWLPWTTKASPTTSG